MMLLAVLLAGVAFYEAFVGLRTLRHIKDMTATTSASLGIVKSTTMSDEEKAGSMQASSLRMLSALFAMLWKILAATAAAALVLYVASFALGSFEDLLAYSIRPLPLVAVIVFLVVYGKLRHGRAARS